MVFIHLFVSIQVTGNFLRGAMLEVDTGLARVIVPDGASPAERRVMYVATPAGW